MPNSTLNAEENPAIYQVVAEAQPGLYGIRHSNRTGDDLWGKNQFNSTFPTSLACLMRDQGINVVYLSVNNELQVVASEMSVAELFNTELENDLLQFDFETKFEPYQKYAIGDIGGIDLVVRHHDDATPNQWRRPLEVKLTVLPDNTTCDQPEEDWGSELVIRPASTKYCALGIRDSLNARNRTRAAQIFEGVCGTFTHWDSGHEVIAKKGALVTALNEFQSEFIALQKPFLMQPIWKTEGKSPGLAKQAFDVFVWSDFALCRTFIDKSTNGAERGVNRYLRSSARLARVLYDLSTTDHANINRIYTEMAFGLQTDKEFALPGNTTRQYMNSPRRITPALPRETVVSVITGGGQAKLSPERRFDASIYFTAQSMFNKLEQ